MPLKPKFETGQTVLKWTGDYQGPGIVRGIAGLANGKLRYLVGHKIEGGIGEFLHVYAEGNLREIDVVVIDPLATVLAPDHDLPSADDVKGILKPDPDHTELVEALCEAHRQVDMMLAQMVMADKTFMPSKSPYWAETVKRFELIQKHGGVV